MRLDGRAGRQPRRTLPAGSGRPALVPRATASLARAGLKTGPSRCRTEWTERCAGREVSSKCQPSGHGLLSSEAVLGDVDFRGFPPPPTDGTMMTSCAQTVRRNAVHAGLLRAESAHSQAWQPPGHCVSSGFLGQRHFTRDRNFLLAEAGVSCPSSPGEGPWEPALPPRDVIPAPSPCAGSALWSSAVRQP